MSNDDFLQHFKKMGKKVNLEVKDYGYPEIAIFDYSHGEGYRGNGHRFINIPTDFQSIIVPGPYGLEIGGNIDGITEVLSLKDRDFLEICFINDSGKLLDSEDILVRKKIENTKNLIRRNVDERNFEMCKWARSRLASIDLSNSNYFRSGLYLDDKIVDREDIYSAAQTSRTEWNLFATMLYSYESLLGYQNQGVRDCLDIFLTNKKNNIEMSFNSLLVIGVLSKNAAWSGIINEDDYTSLFIEEGEFIEALSELEKLGFVENPASVKSVLGCAQMSKLRGKFSEFGIKAQGKELLIERAIADLGERGIKKLFENDDDIDFDIAIFTPKVQSQFFGDWGATINKELDIIMSLIESRMSFGAYARYDDEAINFVMPFGIEITESEESEDDDSFWEFEVKCKYCKNQFTSSIINEHQSQCDENPWKESGLQEWVETCQKSIEQLSDLLNREDSELTNETKEYLIEYIHHISGLFRSD